MNTNVDTDERNSDIDAIINIAKKYFYALYNADTEILREIFHREVIMWGARDASLELISLDEFIAKIADLPVPSDNNEAVDMKIKCVELSGPIGMVCLENLHLGERYTDYLFFMRLDNVWTIIGKSYYVHML